MGRGAPRYKHAGLAKSVTVMDHQVQRSAQGSAKAGLIMPKCWSVFASNVRYFFVSAYFGHP